MSDNDLKTLREHNVQVGDVVASIMGEPRTIRTRDGELWLWADESDWFGTVANSSLKYRVISRANVAPAIDLTANRMAFGLLDDATKASFKAHVAAGGKVEVYTRSGWLNISHPQWSITAIHRAVPPPTRGEVVMFGNKYLLAGTQWKADSHRLTLPTLDGVLICGTYTGPDGAQVVIATIDGDDK